MIIWISTSKRSKKCNFKKWTKNSSRSLNPQFLVMGNLSLKIWNFKANIRGGNQLKITMVKKDLSSRCKLRKVFNFFFSKKCDLRFKNMKKTEIPKMVSKRLWHHLRNYERLTYLSLTLDLTISNNTNVNQRKSKHYEKFNFGREKIQKYVTSKMIWKLF